MTEAIPYQEILDDLNRVCLKVKPFTPTEGTKRLIRARWKDGFRVADFEEVHRRMKDAADRDLWWPGKKMHEFLRPGTLYSGKFEMYLKRDWEAGRGGDDLDAWGRGGDVQ